MFPDLRPAPRPAIVLCTLRVCGRKKLPFAEYSVVKERAPHGGAPHKTGGEYRARTGDLLVANQALSQLS